MSNKFEIQIKIFLEKREAKAKEPATCDGPPYHYKVAYEEAERLFEKLK